MQSSSFLWSVIYILFCPPAMLTIYRFHIPPLCSFPQHPSRGTHSPSYSFVLPRVPCPVFTPICKTHKMRTDSGWKTNSPFLCFAPALPLIPTSLLILFIQSKSWARATVAFHQVQDAISVYTEPLSNTLRTMRRHERLPNTMFRLSGLLLEIGIQKQMSGKRSGNDKLHICLTSKVIWSKSVMWFKPSLKHNLVQ